MPHNLLITKPGSLEAVGAIADEQVTDPKALARDYVPDSKMVLWATKLVNYQETVRLRFTAPTRPGDYPYLCTFPVHWRMMNGVMKVTGETETARVVYDGFDGPGKGKHVVLISGDEEYRSEEALPQLGKILAAHHGFTCTVLFAIDPDTGEIDPNRRDNIPGLDSLETADLMIIATRFRDLPDEQMKRIDEYLKSGRPVIGMRTATHGFMIGSNRTYAHYSNGYRGPKKQWRDGFGRLVLGEKWINHHGRHGRESARGVIAKGARNHPIVRGIRDGDVWGPSDVYGVRLPLSGDGKAIVLGQVLTGMKPGDPPVPGKKNNPMMPVGWTKTYKIPGGKRGRVFTTTMGASTDLVAAGTRRMLVNAVYWCLEMENKIPRQGAKVDIVGKYNPRPFRSGGFKKGVKPADHAIKR